MTEAEWLVCTDSGPMLIFQRDQSSDRKRRLFAVACCRSIWSLLPDDRVRHAVRIAERYADGTVTNEALEAVRGELWGIVDRWDSAARGAEAEGPAARAWATDLAARAAAFVVDPDFPELATVAAEATILTKQRTTGRRAAEEEEQELLVARLRDLFGNPFRPVHLEPSWLTAKVVHLAQEIYEERAFDRMPELADALEEAGCQAADILAHCRAPGLHVKGCWVVDLVLGKE